MPSSLVSGHDYKSKTNTSVGIGPETGAASPSSGVPLDEVGNGDSILLRDGVTILAALDKMELLAVGNHAVLNRLRRGVGRRWRRT